MTIQARNKPKPGDLQKKLDRDKKMSLTQHRKDEAAAEVIRREMDRKKQDAQHQ